MPGANFHTVYMNLEVLLIECRACERHASLTREDGAPIWQGNMKPVSSAKFKCRKCGSTDVRAYIPRTQDQIDMFLAGDPAGRCRRRTDRRLSFEF